MNYNDPVCGMRLPDTNAQRCTNENTEYDFCPILD